MKKLLLIGFVILSVSEESISQTNVYYPFPDSGADWYVECMNSGNQPPLYSHPHYMVNGLDTNIGAKTYTQIYDSIYFVGGYRQDTINKKVYAVTFWTNYNEILLYDFGLSLGDTFAGRFLADCDSISIVTSIDSVLIGSQYRKRINLVSQQFATPVSIIEGIGSVSGLFEISCFELACNLCFFKDVHGTYGSSPCTNGINEIKNNFSFSPSPNPSSGIFTLSSSEKISQLIIMGAFGNQVYKSYASIPLSVTFDLSSHPKGIYFVKVIDEKGNFGVKKIMLQ